MVSKKRAKVKRKKRNKRNKKPSAYAFLLATLEDPSTAPIWFPTGEVLIRWDRNGVNGYEVWSASTSEMYASKCPENAIPFPNKANEGKMPIGLIEEILDGFAAVAPGLAFRYELVVVNPKSIRGAANYYRIFVEFTTETLHRITDLIRSD